MNEVVRAAKKVGSCLHLQRFQVLCEAGLLPGAPCATAGYGLFATWWAANRSARTPLLPTVSTGTILRMPIATWRGLLFCRRQQLRELNANGQVG